MNFDMHTVVEISAAVTPAMIVVLGFAHGFKSVAAKLHEHALTTASKSDDKITSRIVYVADWIDTIATAIAHAASAGYFLRPATRTSRPPAANHGDET